jgi:xanthine dehydrogenase accessory factor
VNAVNFFEKIAAFCREGRSFAIATVVARRAPVSAHLGDRAIVFADGRVDGFVGGACSRDIIRKQALEAIEARCGRLVSIRPDASESAASTPEHVVVPMTCVSEGAIDVYIEPFVQPRRLIVVGATPVAESLARLARSMDYDVVRVVESREQSDLEGETAALGITLIALDSLAQKLQQDTVTLPHQAAVVVASQGHYDEQALKLILRCGVSYVGLVASRKRGAAIKDLLKQSGLAGVDEIRIPAGIDLGARTPPEVALSILAEIIQSHPSGAYQEGVTAAAAPPLTTTPNPRSAIDPVCGMQVDVSSATPTAKVDDLDYYFCCANCRARFIQEPSRYRTVTL